MDSAGQFLEKGDLIEFKNEGYLPAHWGIYDGTGKIIHVTGDENKESISLLGEVVAAVVGKVEAYVRRESLKTVVKGRKFYKNNMLDKTYKPLKGDLIIKETTKYIGKVWEYKLLSSNCEHFASEMRYGVARSMQAVDAIHLGKKVAATTVTTAAFLGSLSLNSSR